MKFHKSNKRFIFTKTTLQTSLKHNFSTITLIVSIALLSVIILEESTSVLIHLA